ncbi:CopD family protein [Peribacillus frigoritolerans]|jgi:putative copper resistance protein D|uniref:copper resistance D family protein n=1 Tax=Peribacillus frigoritolerans TaxID=450367 RepID=UPI002E224152|nr:CopD family protein [Peribacillus frigoritolerans]
MLIVGMIGEVLLYLCFSLIIGSLILHLVPNSKRPDIFVPKGALLTAVGGIAIFSFIPVLQLVLHLYQDIGVGQTFQSVLFTFEVGKAWIFTYLVSNLLFIFIVWFDYKKKPLYAIIGMLFTLILILALGWASHASSLEGWKGSLTHTSHFIAVTVWVGILLVVGWFSKDHSNWLNFLRWFSPVAITCLTVTIITGIILMTFVVDIKDYVNAWLLSYGQTLLIKHLLIIPLLAYAIINSILIRKKLRTNTSFNPKPWARVESIVILLIFSATAALGQQSPPHDIVTTVKSEGASKLFTTLYQGSFNPDMVVNFSFNATSAILIVLAVLFLVLTIYSFIKKTSTLVSFFMSILFVFSSYLSLILSIK